MKLPKWMSVIRKIAIPAKAPKKARKPSKRWQAIQERCSALGLTLIVEGRIWLVFRVDPVHGRREISYCPNLAAVEYVLNLREKPSALVSH